MARPRKGVVPPHLRRFLFKKGHRKVRRKKRKVSVTRKRLLKVRRRPRAHRVRRRKSNPIHESYVIRADKGRTKLFYTRPTPSQDGRFSNHGKRAQFSTQHAAAEKARALIRKFPILRSWTVWVVPAGK